MKSTLLLASFLAVAVSSAMAAPNDPVAPSTPAPAAKQPTISTSSHVTVTIESGGKKETHEIDLGSTPTLNLQGRNAINIAAGPGGKSSAANAETPSQSSALTVSSITFPSKSGPVPWLGVTMEPVSEELLAQLPIEKGAGLILKSVVPDSPAARAGLQKNDVLVKLEDQLLINSNQLSALIQMKKDGEKVRLTYFRGGKSSTAEAQIQMHQEDYTGTTFVSGGTLTLPGATVEKHGNNLSTNLGEMVVVDKDGHVLITKTQPDLGAVTAQVEKILRAAGVDDKTITQTELAIAEAAKATSSAASSIGNASGDAASQIKNAKDQVAKSLEKVRVAAEQAQKKVEEARERVEKQLEKRGDQTKAPAAQESKAPATQ